MAESPKSTQKKITSFTSGSNSSQESSGHDETKTPKKSSEKKFKRKHQSTSESESPNKDESARKNSTHNGVDVSTSSSSSPSVHAWTFEEEQMLLQKVEEYLQEKESSDDAKKKPFYLKSIEWDKLSVCGDHTTQQAHARFMTISNRVRKMRTAMEILQDMKDHHKKAPPTAKKRKLDVDPDLPKKPLSSYFQFSMAKRKKVAEKHPELNSVEIGKKLSKRWNNLSDEKKQKYSDNYHKGMEEYHHQMIEYLQKVTQFIIFILHVLALLLLKLSIF